MTTLRATRNAITTSRTLPFANPENTFAGGDHLIFIGLVDRAIYRDGKPLIFSAGRFCVPSALDETLISDADGFYLPEA